MDCARIFRVCASRVIGKNRKEIEPASIVFDVLRMGRENDWTNLRPQELDMIGIEKIDHICIAVQDLEKARKVWEPFLGKSAPDLAYRHDPEAIDVVRYYVGEVGYELMASTRDGSEVERFIRKRGEGVMLVSFKVPDTLKAMETLRHAGFEMLDREPRIWENSRYAFLNPAFMNGVLVEVID